MKGIYILMFKMKAKNAIEVGKMGDFTFEEAFYAYIGSAMSGDYRLKRHLKNIERGEIKNKHWHIDFIIPYCKLIGWFFVECDEKDNEEKMANLLSKSLDYVKNFGASDSRAPSHLFKSKNLKMLKFEIRKVLKSLNMEKFKYSEGYDFVSSGFLF